MQRSNRSGTEPYNKQAWLFVRSWRDITFNVTKPFNTKLKSKNQKNEILHNTNIPDPEPILQMIEQHATEQVTKQSNPQATNRTPRQPQERKHTQDPQTITPTTGPTPKLPCLLAIRIFPQTQPIPRYNPRQTNTQCPTPTTPLIYGKTQIKPSQGTANLTPTNLQPNPTTTNESQPHAVPTPAPLIKNQGIHTCN